VTTGGNSGGIDLLVKGTAVEMSLASDVSVDPPEAHEVVAALGERVRLMKTVDVLDGAKTRRGWDADRPWTAEEAAERARHYWPLALERVIRWCEDPGSAPQSLLLGIPLPDGRTVVRYAWQIDAAGVWSHYVDSGRWGIPIGRPLLSHPRLGHVLYEYRDGRRVQVLLNHSSGIRELPSISWGGLDPARGASQRNEDTDQTTTH
jgi:hypothetical protein